MIPINSLLLGQKDRKIVTWPLKIEKKSEKERQGQKKDQKGDRRKDRSRDRNLDGQTDMAEGGTKVSGINSQIP